MIMFFKNVICQNQPLIFMYLNPGQFSFKFFFVEKKVSKVRFWLQFSVDFLLDGYINFVNVKHENLSSTNLYNVYLC